MELFELLKPKNMKIEDVGKVLGETEQEQGGHDPRYTVINI